MSKKYTGKGAHAPGRCEHGSHPQVKHQSNPPKNDPTQPHKGAKPDTAAKGK
jgi:hypothetical protein